MTAAATRTAPSTLDLLVGAGRRDVVARGARYAVFASGAGSGAGAPPVVLLHGVPETSACWRDLMPALAVDREVFAVDLKGLGESQVEGPYDIPTVVAELVDVIGQLAAPAGNGTGPADRARVDLVGHDWGGSLSAVIAASRPDLVRRLVVVSAPYRKVSYLRAPHMPFFALPGAPEALFKVRGASVVDDLFRLAWRADVLDADVLAHYRAAYADPERFEAMLGWYRATVRHRVASGARRTGRAVASAPSRVRSLTGGRGDMFTAATAAAGTSTAEPPIHCEAHLVVWGCDDPVMPISVGEAACRDMRDPFTMITMPGVGHWPVEEASPYAVPLIADFLRAP